MFNGVSYRSRSRVLSLGLHLTSSLVLFCIWFQEAHQQAEVLKREKEEIMGKLSQADMKFTDGKNRVKKLEEDNEKLRRALEQSMSRLNRMSVDSDFLVDRLEK